MVVTHDPIFQRPQSDDGEWLTPPSMFDALAFTFDLDPCSPGPHHWVPARQVYTKADDGLSRPWVGIVWCNPPFGGRSNRNGVVPWLRKMVEHGSGIALVPAYTSSGWFHAWAPQFDAMVFPRGKTKFIRDGVEAKSPAGGVVLLGKGLVACEVLRDACVLRGLGMYLGI